MALLGELFGRLGNDDVNRWLQLRAWQQSVLLAHAANDVIAAPAGVATATARDVIAPADEDNRFQSAASGKRLDD